MNKAPDMQSAKGKRAYMKKYITLNNLVLLYLWAPLAVFFACWVKWYLAVPALFLMCLGLYLNFREHVRRDSTEENGRIGGSGAGNVWAYWLLSVFILFVWCVLSGQKTFTQQAGDWAKHNALLADLIIKPWPVRYQYYGMEGTLSYYLLGYLIPAAFGKWMGTTAAEWALFFQTFAGLVLILFLMVRCLNVKNKPGGVLICCLVFILFSAFNFPFCSIYKAVFPDDAAVNRQWMSLSILVHYSSNIEQMREVFPQSIPAWTAVLLLMDEEDHIKTWGMICVPVLLYSAFAFLGLAVLAGIRLGFGIWYSKDRSGYIRNLFDLQNLIALAVLTVPVGFIGGNILQPKPESAAMGVALIDYSGRGWLFVLFQMTWIIWAVVLGMRERKNLWLYGASATLFVLPFFHMGYYNDLCLRVSIPALFVLCVLTAKNLVCPGKRTYRLLLAALVLISSCYGLKEMKWVSGTWGNSENRQEYYAGLVNLFDRYEFTVYQYVDWTANDGISRWILKESDMNGN